MAVHTPGLDIREVGSIKQLSVKAHELSGSGTQGKLSPSDTLNGVIITQRGSEIVTRQHHQLPYLREERVLLACFERPSLYPCSAPGIRVGRCW